MTAHAGTVRVNPAPVLTLWAAIVAGRLGHPPETALTLGAALAGTVARPRTRGDQGQKPAETVRLLGRDIPVLRGADGTLRAAAEDGGPASATAIGTYLARAFGNRLDEVRMAMEERAASIGAEELSRIGLHLYEQFRPRPPEGAQGWHAKGVLDLARLRGAPG